MGILRAIADLLGGSIKSVSLGITEPSSAAFADEDRDSMAELASQYDEVRRTMSPGSARTQVITQIVATMRLKAAAVRSLLSEYMTSNSAGFRLAGIRSSSNSPTHLICPGSRKDWIQTRKRPSSGILPQSLSRRRSAASPQRNMTCF